MAHPEIHPKNALPDPHPEIRIESSSGAQDTSNDEFIDIGLVVHVEDSTENPRSGSSTLKLGSGSLKSLKELWQRLYGAMQRIERHKIVLECEDREHERNFFNEDELNDALASLRKIQQPKSKMQQPKGKIQCHAWFPKLDPSQKSTLLAKLQERKKDSALTIGPFIPNAVFDNLLNETEIRKFCKQDEDLSRFSPEETRQIFERGRKLLAIFLLLGFTSESPGHNFKRAWMEGKRDDNLPFERNESGFLWLEDNQLDIVCFLQWQTLAMEFHELSGIGIIPKKYHTRIPIPIIHRKYLGKGFFSTVYKIKIEASHQKIYCLGNDDNPDLALKEYRKSTRGADFCKELEWLLKIGHSKHRHLIRLLSAFRHGENCYLVLPLAKCNLKHWFEVEDHQPFKRTDPKDFRGFVIWILKQFKGLADALNVLHGGLDLTPRISYHHDFKPANILYFKSLARDSESDSGLADWEESYGRLQLSDLGLGEIREQNEGTHTMDLRCISTYAAPETMPNQPQGREVDIWAFACVILEVFVWLIEGPRRTKTFSNARNAEVGGPKVQTDAYFKEVPEKGFDVCSVATRKVQTIRKAARENDGNGAVNMIMNLVRSCWKIERMERPRASDLVKRLEEAIDVARQLPQNQSFFESKETIDRILSEEYTRNRSGRIRRYSVHAYSSRGVYLPEFIRSEPSVVKQDVQTIYSAETKFGLPPNERDEQTRTDSGYASGTYGKSIQTYGSAGKDLEVMLVDNEYDSGNLAIVRSNSSAIKQDVQNMGLYTAKTEYSASETSSLPALRDEGYISDLAKELFSALKPCKPDGDTLERISEMFPDLLRAFALKLGHEAQTPMHRDVSFFVHKNRRRIQGFFEDMFPLKNVVPSDADGIQNGDFALRRFLEEQDDNIYEYHENEPRPTSETHEDLDWGTNSPEPNDEDEASDEDTETAPNTSAYHDFIVKTAAYNWLVASLRKETTLTRPNPDLMENIRTEIFAALPSIHRVSRRVPSQGYKVIFELDWDPLSFVKEQQYIESADKALERAITLTGSANDAQALTTREYLRQMWPTTGEHVMRLVTIAVQNTRGHHSAFNLPDGTELEARIEGSKFIVTTIGTGDSLAEIGQQFAWLGAALRSSPFKTGVAISSAFVRAQASEITPSVEIRYQIGFKIDQPAARGGGQSGECWHSMFRNPVMVSGYPTLTKHEGGLGIEMPLNMIGALAGSKRANTFDGKVFVKGFSAMLIATKITRDLLIWHYCYNNEGGRISYLDHQIQVVDNISLLQLDSVRHVVGWCSDCMYFAGAADAQYSVDGTGLPRPHAGCLLEKVSISGGKLITGGMTFAIAVKDVPPHLIRDGYIPKLRWIATKYVVLWDDADKRGWLVNGTSALLHLVRAWLEHSSRDDFSYSFLFDSSKMKDANKHKPNSAPQILSDEDNLDLKVHLDRIERFEEEEVKQEGSDTGQESKTSKKKRSYYLFQNLVEQHFEILEKIMEHHTQVAGQNGLLLKARIRKRLEGWDFVDLATNHDPYPRVATLNALGYGWVDFIRSIDAITLFGRGFGDIIRPIEFNGMCTHWKSLPRNKSYLAASVFDLKNIIKKFGDKWANPPKPVHDLLWHCPEALVAPCPCQQSGVRPKFRRAVKFKSHHDPVQVFWPTRKRLLFPIRGPGELEDDGAVVFGHSITWGYHWREDGNEDVCEGDPPSLGAPENQFLLAPTASSSESSDPADSSLSSRSPQSSESRTAATTNSSLSVINSAHALTSVEPEQTYNSPRPGQETVMDQNGTRTLRHERRKTH
ncbi:MAG: hypothetical protein M1822_004213 [Bathelium mastoideum]|nr:MAG: hypothetical protein M1822_004213 [Bathelium mastoideum]